MLSFLGNMQTLAEPAIATRPLAADRLSDRLAADLRSRIDSGALPPGQRLPTELALPPGQRLPTELALAAQYTVSRSVVREAVSRLRSSGLLVARQGSGVFVASQDVARPLDFEAAVLVNLDAVLDVVEVRRAPEAEVAALAASRATPAQRAAIVQALARMDALVASGSAAVGEDLDVHRTIADAAGNVQFLRLLRQAMAATRRNESMKAESMTELRQEHRAIVARDAAEHMRCAARRLQDADAPIHQHPAGKTP